ncbi:hypothetical protein PCASD_02838 [Puccinia coronata f. sp. avenae]|uniref:Fe2OG dioxygenase domain-containing protein n=1 Tax=Puccinia coronata f. sp. avenae TaxID=200324 RepID=A0A2N5VFR5_9BASI|nr:hypothetical protein PCASD_15911 [Puccinia coronata f. sp. avenae]PLW48839.1 hypothetical protein PCASD_02838 [Puccinia coronata f. sp. avenae]
MSSARAELDSADPPGSESLDASIATLASIFEDHDCEQLQAALHANHSNLDLAIDYLIRQSRHEAQPDPVLRHSPRRPRQRSPENLSSNKKRRSNSLQSWLSPAGNQHKTPQTSRASLDDQNSSLNKHERSQGPSGSQRSPYPGSQVATLRKPVVSTSSLRPMHEVLGQSSSLQSFSLPPKPIKRATLPPLFLSTPQQVSKHLPCCSLIYGILPKPLAWNLYDAMVQDCNGTAEGKKKPWIRNRWWLADREVQSPHSTAFFIAKPTAHESLADNYNESAQYWYAGKPLEEDAQPRYFLDEMDEARSTIESTVNQLLSNDPEILVRAQRDPQSNPITRYDQEWHGPWRANVAASNCYRGSKENVGWHADQLTYLGPYPTIASLSLGTTRQFRLRPVANMHQRDPEPMRTFSISLPHNSLLVMHGGCQERYKHCIPPQTSLDVFKNPLEPTDTRIERINITFRFYRPDFQPSRKISTPAASSSSSSAAAATAAPSHGIITPQPAPQVSVTPRCHCGIPAVLRADQKGKVAASHSRQLRRAAECSGQTNAHVDFQFFWHCQAGQQNAGRGCTFFQILNFDSESRGPCLGDIKKQTVKSGGELGTDAV